MSANTPQDTNSMEQVRELLFGAQIKRIDDHFAELEKQTAARFEDLREEILKQIKVLDKRLSNQLETERDERGQAEVASDERFDSFARDMEIRLEMLNNSLQDADADIKQYFMAENERIRVLMEDCHSSAMHNISENTTHIRTDMVYRATIADLLNDLAAKLGPQAPVSTPKAAKDGK